MNDSGRIDLFSLQDSDDGNAVGVDGDVLHEGDASSDCVPMCY